MDFFSQQDQARKSSKVLIALFATAVIILIGLTNILIAVCLWLFNEQIAGGFQAYQQTVSTLNYHSTQHFFAYFSWNNFGLISLAVTGVIGCAVGYKWLRLSGGGKNVAEQLGGHRIYPNTMDLNEQRLLNVVEEMAIASGMPVPSVYLLSEEICINAFAAGSTTADAVIGITQGCLMQFDREQLQGVIAHEFSHILNGDMRLNIRLIAVLHGILFIGLVGEMLVRSTSLRGRQSGFLSRRRSSNSSLAMIGFSLLAIGWLGRFFGNWIKSSVSRQREFLADASAVQFTRNPKGIGDALKIIGGYLPASKLDSNHANEMSHLFFGQVSNSFNSLFSTHPPLEKRINRIEPNWDGQFIIREAIKKSTDNISTASPLNSTGNVSIPTAIVSSLAGTTTAYKKDSLNEFKIPRLDIPAKIIVQAHDSFSAMAILYALLLSDDSTIQKKQFSYIEMNHIQGLSHHTLLMLSDINFLNKCMRLPLIQICLPALKSLSKDQYQSFCKTLLLLIRADKKFELFEWCMYQLTRHFLDAEFSIIKKSNPLYKSIDQVTKEFEVVLSMLCHYGENDKKSIQQAFGKGANLTGLYTITLLEKSSCDLNTFVDATLKLAQCYPLLKPKLIKGLVESAKHDGQLSIVEHEMIHAIAAVMDSPVPLLN